MNFKKIITQLQERTPSQLPYYLDDIDLEESVVLKIKNININTDTATVLISTLTDENLIKCIHKEQLTNNNLLLKLYKTAFEYKKYQFCLYLLDFCENLSLVMSCLLSRNEYYNSKDYQNFYKDGFADVINYYEQLENKFANDELVQELILEIKASYIITNANIQYYQKMEYLPQFQDTVVKILKTPKLQQSNKIKEQLILDNHVRNLQLYKYLEQTNTEIAFFLAVKLGDLLDKEIFIRTQNNDLDFYFNSEIFKNAIFPGSTVFQVKFQEFLHTKLAQQNIFKFSIKNKTFVLNKDEIIFANKVYQNTQTSTEINWSEESSNINIESVMFLLSHYISQEHYDKIFLSYKLHNKSNQSIKKNFIFKI